MIPAPISAPSAINRRSNAMTFLNEARTSFFHTDGFIISDTPISGENRIFPTSCFPIL